MRDDVGAIPGGGDFAYGPQYCKHVAENEVIESAGSSTVRFNDGFDAPNGMQEDIRAAAQEEPQADVRDRLAALFHARGMDGALVPEGRGIERE